MITICGDIIRRKLLEKVRKAGFFSVIANEATDVANDEQHYYVFVLLIVAPHVRSSWLSWSVSLESQVK